MAKHRNSTVLEYFDSVSSLVVETRKETKHNIDLIQEEGILAFLVKYRSSLALILNI